MSRAPASVSDVADQPGAHEARPDAVVVCPDQFGEATAGALSLLLARQQVERQGQGIGRLRVADTTRPVGETYSRSKASRIAAARSP